MNSEDWLYVFNDYYVNRLLELEISEKYNLSVKRLLYKSFPVYQNPNLMCEHCGSLLEATFKGKSSSVDKDYLVFDLTEVSPLNAIYKRDSYSFNRPSKKSFITAEGYKVSIPTCPDCGHKPTSVCTCEGCLKLKSRNIELILQKYLEEYVTPNEPDIESFSIQQLFSAIHILKVSSEVINFSKLGGTERMLLLATNLFMPDKTSMKTLITMRSNYHFMIDSPGFYVQNYSFPRKNLIKKLSQRIKDISNCSENYAEIMKIWLNLAFEEANDVFSYYGIYGVGNKTISTLIEHSLRNHGLSKTCSYIRNALIRARERSDWRKGPRIIINTKVEDILNFWVHSDKAEEYTIRPHTRGAKVLLEPASVSEFSRLFLKPNSIDYFNSPIDPDLFY